MPVRVITITTNDTQYESGLRMFEISFNRTNNIDTPMELEVIRTTKEKFWELRWKSKLLYALKSLRCDTCLTDRPISCQVLLCLGLQHPA